MFTLYMGTVIKNMIVSFTYWCETEVGSGVSGFVLSLDQLYRAVQMTAADECDHRCVVWIWCCDGHSLWLVLHRLDCDKMIPQQLLCPDFLTNQTC